MATLEQLLHETLAPLCRDVQAVEDRLMKRFDAERLEQQAALANFRRDLSLQRAAANLGGASADEALADLRGEFGGQLEQLKLQGARLEAELRCLREALEDMLALQHGAGTAPQARDLAGACEVYGSPFDTLVARMQAAEAGAEHVALAACVGELDAELRMEFAGRINDVTSDLRSEIGKQVGELAAQMEESMGNSELFVKLEQRVGRLEASGFDLRLLALESASHHAAFFTSQMAPAQTTVPEAGRARVDGEEASLEADRRDICLLSAAAAAANSTPAMPSRQSRAHPMPLSELDLHQLQLQTHPSGSICNSPLGNSASQVGIAEISARIRSAGPEVSPPHFCFNSPDRAAPASAVVAAAAASMAVLAEERQAESSVPWAPLISDELKVRLEGLVKSVKRTLNSEEPLNVAAPTPSPPQQRFSMADSAFLSMVNTGRFTPSMHYPLQLPGGLPTPVEAWQNMALGSSEPAVSCAGSHCRAASPRSRMGRATVISTVIGPPVLRSVSLTRPRSPSPLRFSTRQRSPSPIRVLRYSTSGVATESAG